MFALPDYVTLLSVIYRSAASGLKSVLVPYAALLLVHTE